MSDGNFEWLVNAKRHGIAPAGRAHPARRGRCSPTSLGAPYWSGPRLSKTLAAQSAQSPCDISSLPAAISLPHQAHTSVGSSPAWSSGSFSDVSCTIRWAPSSVVPTMEIRSTPSTNARASWKSSTRSRSCDRTSSRAVVLPADRVSGRPAAPGGPPPRWPAEADDASCSTPPVRFDRTRCALSYRSRNSRSGATSASTSESAPGVGPRPGPGSACKFEPLVPTELAPGVPEMPRLARSSGRAVEPASPGSTRPTMPPHRGPAPTTMPEMRLSASHPARNGRRKLAYARILTRGGTISASGGRTADSSLCAGLAAGRPVPGDET
jgi:hypothetical protein